MELVAGLSGASDRAGGMFVAGFLGDGLVLVRVERSADGFDPDALVLLEDVFELGGDHLHTVEQPAAIG